MTASEDFEALLGFLKESRGFDFSGYKRTTLLRRLESRMHTIGVEGFDRYRERLEVDPDEFTHLFNTVLINVTGFFRDGPIWSYLESDIIPRIIDGKEPSAPIRVWSAGSASGEEAYSAAILLAEQLGWAAFSERVRIYATDLDEEALVQARHGAYGEKSIQAVPERFREKYFKKQNSNYVFDRDLRRALIFGRHDLVKDSPISRIDLLLCRNTLMYFNAETQQHLLANLRFALNEDGYLVLGKAEMLFTRSKFFTPVDLRRRVFTKSATEDPLQGHVLPHRATAAPGAVVENDLDGRDAAFESGGLAQIVIDARGIVVLANAKARAQLKLSPDDVGRPFQDLMVSYQPVELRAPIEEARRSRLPVMLNDVRGGTPPDTLHTDIEIIPLTDTTGGYYGVSLTFRDVTGTTELRQELEQANQELETAMEELQSTNEELETAMEELQSTNEELETTNEELQSTNEELETMNEELQSTNEELQTLNDEMRERTDQLNDINAFMESILGSFQTGVIAVDTSLMITVWNRQIEELFGLRRDEVEGKPLMNLDAGLPVDRLKPLLRACLDEGSDREELTLAVVTRRGRTIEVRVACVPQHGASGTIEGAILFISAPS